jgi:hypothetical protein
VAFHQGAGARRLARCDRLDELDVLTVNLGKLLTGQDFGGDAKKCMDTIAAAIDAAVTEAGL